MSLMGYLIYGLYVFVPLLGAIVASLRARTYALLLVLLWSAVIVAGLSGLVLLAGRQNHTQSQALLIVEIMMYSGIVAWVLLVPTIAFRASPSDTSGIEEECDEEEAGDDNEEGDEKEG